MDGAARKRHPAPGCLEPTPDPDSDGLGNGEVWTLVRRAQAGDSDAFGQIYDRYVDAVYRYVYYRVADRSTAEDLTADTFVRALRRLSTVTYQGRDIGAWLMTIARNLVLDHVKSSRYRLEITTAEITEREHVEGPERSVLTRLDSQQMVRCLRLLSPEQQECVVLRFLQDFSVAETAQVMGKTDGAVKALQHRALRRLAVLMRAHQGDPA